jgi:hypothetical protein
MTTIAIESTKKLQFPPFMLGYVKMEIDLIQNKPVDNVYELRITDTCFDKITEKKLKEDYVPVDGQQPLESDYEELDTIKVLGVNTRFVKYSYELIKGLETSLGVTTTKKFLVEKEQDLFQKGLLAITQKECVDGISGEGKGMYFSEVGDWKISQ